MIHLWTRILRFLDRALALPIILMRFLRDVIAGHYQRYRVLRTTFSKNYLRIASYSNFQTSLWSDFNKRAEQVLLPFPNWNFLGATVLQQTMLIQKRGELLFSQQRQLIAHWGMQRALHILNDPSFGNPPIDSLFLRTSHNTIHHASHLVTWERTAKASIANLSTIIEWGGGYGNLARLSSRLNAHGTYIIIDTPLFAQLQWLYLSVTVPHRSVNLIMNSEQPILENAISIIPVGLISQVAIPKADLFISTWALSESSKEAQEYVAHKYWFGAQHLLLGYQERSQYLPDSDYLGLLAQQSGATITPVPHLKRQYYALL